MNRSSTSGNINGHIAYSAEDSGRNGSVGAGTEHQDLTEVGDGTVSP